MSLSDIPLPIYYVAIPMAYIFLGGLTHALSDFARDEKVMGAIFWPVVWAGWIIYQVAIAGPRLVTWNRDRRKRLRIPRAEVVSK
jgi:hypothetical protein